MTAETGSAANSAKHPKGHSGDWFLTPFSHQTPFRANILPIHTIRLFNLPRRAVLVSTQPSQAESRRTHRLFFPEPVNCLIHPLQPNRT